MIALVSFGHLVDDIYQGIVPAMLPFLIAERHYSYAAVSGIALAATVLSSVAQPAFGIWADRRSRPWLIAVGLLVAGVGVAVAGLFDSYWWTWSAVAISGLGVAAFHPEAARAARQGAGNSNTAMSIFALGGNAGFAVGTAIATPLLLLTGLAGLPLLVIPAVVMAVIVQRRLAPALRPKGRRAQPMPTGNDDWAAFSVLTSIVIVRSIFFFGLTSFIALYLIDQLHTSEAVAGAGLTTYLVAGALGTILGGRIADRFSPLTSIKVGFALSVPPMAGVLWFDSVPLLFVMIVIVGITSYIPFAVFVVLGQNYLPNRIGTASGVTVGLAASVGGLAIPLLGLLADHQGLRSALMVIAVLPVVALVISAFLRPPGGAAAVRSVTHVRNTAPAAHRRQRSD